MHFFLFHSVALLLVRVVSFWVLQLFFVWGAAHEGVNLNLPLVHTLLLTSACLLAMSLGWCTVEVGKFVSVCFHRGFVPVPPSAEPHAADVLSFSQTIQITPILLWYYVHAIGGSVFILAYCLTGLSVLPTLCLILCITLYIAFFTASEPVHYLRVVWVLCQAFALLFFLLDAISLLDTGVWSTLVLGVTLLLCACSLILKLTRALQHIPMSPHDVLAFTLPSLTLLAALCLSLYFATSDVSTSSYYYDLLVPNATHNDLNATFMSALSADLYSLFFVSPSTNTTAAYHHNATMMLTLHTPGRLTFFTEDKGAGLVLLALLCPPAMYALLLLFFASFRSVASTTHNVSAFAFAYALRRFWHPADYSFLSALSLLCTALACLMTTITTEDDEQEEVVYDRETAVSSNTPLDANAI